VFEQVITVEEGVRSGGFGESVAAWLCSNGYNKQINIISLPDKFVEHGSRIELLHQCAINKEGIINAVNKKEIPIEIEV
jgi:1-deoxy-D-xylulose-5-phosphate synthase